ncbi:MAG UNVERIFIED_CONTAM: hypothetical protein LVR29_14550 [Microcystis novacekii LVE1205-3]
MQGISDMITIPGLVNVDFADVRAVMADLRVGPMDWAVALAKILRAKEEAIVPLPSPLLESSNRGAKGVVFNITGGQVPEPYTANLIAAAEIIYGSRGIPNAKIIFGAVID